MTTRPASPAMKLLRTALRTGKNLRERVPLDRLVHEIQAEHIRYGPGYAAHELARLQEGVDYMRALLKGLGEDGP